LKEQTGHLPLATVHEPQGPHFATIPSSPFAHLSSSHHVFNESNTSLADLDRKIEAAEAQLAQIVADSRCSIKQFQRERAALEEKISRTLAYVSPIRRLPAELLRLIFMMNFDEYPCCAWILSSVCSQWRRLALSMPKLWSKVWYLSQSAFPPYFLRGSLAGQAWASSEHHFPTESSSSIALSHV